MKSLLLGAAALATTVGFASANEMTLPEAVMFPPAPQNGGIVMPLPNLGPGSFAGGVSYDGSTTIVTHQNNGWGTNTGIIYDHGDGYGGGLSVMTGGNGGGGVSGGSISFKFPF